MRHAYLTPRRRRITTIMPGLSKTDDQCSACPHSLNELISNFKLKSHARKLQAAARYVGRSSITLENALRATQWYRRLHDMYLLAINIGIIWRFFACNPLQNCPLSLRRPLQRNSDRMYIRSETPPIYTKKFRAGVHPTGMCAIIQLKELLYTPPSCRLKAQD